MKFILIPVKDLSKANNRLSSILSQENRTSLAYAMLEDVFEAVKQSKLADRVVVVTMDNKAAEISSDHGFYVLKEYEQSGESSSVDRAISECIKMGASSLLVIPGDAPLITAPDIDNVLREEKEGPCVVMVPATDKLGTNAILRKPPDVIPSRFGHDSFKKHIDEARQVNTQVISLDIPNISLDIDEPHDIEAFLARNTDSRTYKELMRLGITSIRIEKTA